MAISQNFPTVRPTLNLNFARSKTLDPRITFERNSISTYVDEDGLIRTAGVDEARFDHDPATGESLGLLIEESTTNLILQSEALNNAEWISFGSLLPFSANAAVAPDGNQTADVPNDISTKWGIYDNSNGGWLTGYPQVYPFTVTSEWTRQSLTFTTPAGCTFIRFYVLRTQNDASYVYDNVTVSAGTTYTASAYYKLHTDGTTVLAWGAQLEEGSFPTSYIPTSSFTVTRAADLAKITGTNFTDFYNQTEGSFVSNIRLNSSFPVSGYASISFTLSDNSFNNRVTLASSTGSAAFNADVTVSGTNTRAVLGNYTSGASSIRISIGYKASDTAGSLNGATVGTSSPGTVPLLTRADIGKDHTNGNLLNGHIRQITYYPQRLTNDQLQSLTK